MAQTSLLPRGFKSKAEKIALEYRGRLNLLPHEPLCGFELAKHLNIAVHTPPSFFGDNTDIEALVGIPGKNSGWSALTMKTASSSTIIIHNHLHASYRQQSDIMHELAHIICKHEQVSTIDGVNLPALMRSYNKQQEEEADCLGSTLQITRDGLVWAFRNKMSIEQMTEYFNASPAMVNKRINFTGIKKQFSYSRF